MRQNGPQDPERDKQFRYIEEECELIKRKGGVILSADVKKKELIGNFKAKGSEWRRSKNPREVEMHDFPLAASEKLIPYGIYDIQNNEAYITLNTSHETAELIYQSIRTWWFEYGSRLYPCAKDLLYLTDAGGSDGYRSRVFKKYMHRLADETGLVIHVSHYPPGTSKWNKIEHRVFAPMSKSMQGKPLICVKYAMLLISNTTTNTGLAVHCRYDPSFYQTGQRLSTQEYSNIPILRKKTVPRLNYYFIPEVFRSVALKWIA
jgi:hypothetical protein